MRVAGIALFVGMRSGLIAGPPLPGLVPVSAAAAELHLATAGARGRLLARYHHYTPEFPSRVIMAREIAAIALVLLAQGR